MSDGKRRQLSTTFQGDEVRAVLEVARILRVGGDASTVVRSKAWNNAMLKFQKLKFKMEGG